jgi:hypothetical protein
VALAQAKVERAEAADRAGVAADGQMVLPLRSGATTGFGFL